MNKLLYLLCVVVVIAVLGLLRELNAQPARVVVSNEAVSRRVSEQDIGAAQDVDEAVDDEASDDEVYDHEPYHAEAGVVQAARFETARDPEKVTSSASWDEDDNLIVEIGVPRAEVSDAAWSAPFSLPFALDAPCDELGIAESDEPHKRWYTVRSEEERLVYTATVSIADILSDSRYAKGVGFEVTLDEGFGRFDEGSDGCRGVVTWDPHGMFRSLSFAAWRGR